MTRTSLSSSLQLFALILIGLNVIFVDQHKALAQRSLQHWKRDLEHRLRSYQEQKDTIRSVISSSIYTSDLGASAHQRLSGPIRVASNGNVRFSDLVIPMGSLRLSNHVAPSSVRILVDKTQAYVNSKANELFQIQDQLETIHRQLDDPSNQYIYKGRRDIPVAARNLSGITIAGTRIFKQVQYAHQIDSFNLTLRRINYTDVDRVIDDTYLRNFKFGVFDSHGRLFFEGRKTFWDTEFHQALQSGCCDRLRPLHTNRMMLRLANQDVRAPILIHSRDTNTHGQVAAIRQLSTTLFYNQLIAVDQSLQSRQQILRPGETNLLPSPPAENFIQLQNLISLTQLNTPQILKTIVFTSPVIIEEALLSNSYPDNRLVIGIASQPGFSFDLSHENYLLRFYAPHRNYTTSSSLPAQVITGALVIDGLTSFLAGVNADSVNRVANFGQFVRESIVSINKPSVIHGPIQFNALPAMLDRNSYSARASNPTYGILNPPGSRPLQNVQILHAFGNLEVGLVNGMSLPRDLVILPRGSDNLALALRPGQDVIVRGARHFENRLTFDMLQVGGLVNGLSLPAGVISLHLNDFMHNVGRSNLRFVDGITVAHMTVQSNQFDDINLHDVQGDAQSIVIRSMSSVQPDGSLLIRAPLQVQNLNLISSGAPNHGLLNGFRPQEVLELTHRGRNPYEILYGRKTFAAPVEAADCIFNDINQVANWTNHLIRIDRPNTVQTVHTRLAFAAPAAPVAASPVNISAAAAPAGLNLKRLDVEFHTGTSKDDYESNWRFSPELYQLHQSLQRSAANYTGGQYRVKHVRLVPPGGGLLNNIRLDDIVTLDRPFRFAGTFVMVGKVEVKSTLRADRVQSTYQIDAMDLVQFEKYRIPVSGNTRAPIKLAQLVLGHNNKASYVQCRMLNGISFNEFAASIMSLTRPQDVYTDLVFSAPVSLEGPVRTRASLNGIKNFARFARSLKEAKYAFEDGLQCNSVVIKT